MVKVNTVDSKGKEIIVNIDTIDIEGKDYMMGYKVVTKDFKSLGLRRNPNILKYTPGEWYFLPEEQLAEGNDDYGGIWLARKYSGARKLMRLMKRDHGVDTKIYKTLLDSILYCNSYRIKTNGVMLLEEMTSDKK